MNVAFSEVQEGLAAILWLKTDILLTIETKKILKRYKRTFIGDTTANLNNEDNRNVS